MEQDYYTVFIDDNGIPKEEAIICQCLGRVDTRIYGRAPIFREIITNAIIRPKYDAFIEELTSETLSVLVYDNININSYSKIQEKKVLTILKNFTENSKEKYIKTITDVEIKQIKKVLEKV